MDWWLWEPLTRIPMKYNVWDSGNWIAGRTVGAHESSTAVQAVSSRSAFVRARPTIEIQLELGL